MAASRPKYNDIVVREIRLRAGNIGLQNRWSVPLRLCLAAVQLYYDRIVILYFGFTGISTEVFTECLYY